MCALLYVLESSTAPGTLQLRNTSEARLGFADANIALMSPSGGETGEDQLDKTCGFVFWLRALPAFGARVSLTAQARLYDWRDK